MDRILMGAERKSLVMSDKVKVAVPACGTLPCLPVGHYALHRLPLCRPPAPPGSRGDDARLIDRFLRSG
jgi:hypothetical protein